MPFPATSKLLPLIVIDEFARPSPSVLTETLGASKDVVAGDPGVEEIHHLSVERDRLTAAPENVVLDSECGGEQEGWPVALPPSTGSLARMPVDAKIAFSLIEAATTPPSEDGRRLAVVGVEHRDHEFAQPEPDRGFDADRRLQAERLGSRDLRSPTATQLRSRKAHPAGRDDGRRPLAPDPDRADAGQPHRLAQRILSRPEADGAAGLRDLVDGILNGELAAGVRFGGHAGGAAAVVSFAGRRPRDGGSR